MNERGSPTSTGEGGRLWINLEQLAATPPETVAQTRRLLDELDGDPPPNVSAPRWQAMLGEARQVLTMIEDRSPVR